MHNEFKGFAKIFSYTFKNQVTTKSYIAITIIIGLVFLILPPAIMIPIELFGDEEPTGLLNTVYVVDNGNFKEVDFSMVPLLFEEFKDVTFKYIGENEQDALSASSENKHSLILDISKEGSYHLNVLLPEESELNYADIDMVTEALYPVFSMILIQSMDLSPEALAALSINVSTSLPSDKQASSDDGEIDNESVEIVSMIIAYLNIMLLYFLVLSYGTSVANSLILEKTSKLMEFFLITVKPGAIMLGKVVGIALSAVMQFIVWILSLIGGFAIGIFGVKLINPESDMMILKILDTASEYTSFISIPGIILGIAIIIAGFFMYCSLAAVGGALARKTEDLGATNYIFTLALVCSLFITMFSGGESLMAYVPWHDFLPFTAVLVTPAHLIVGQTSLIVGGISLLLISLLFFIMIYVSGRIYKSMVFHKGNIPKIKDVIQILTQKE